MISRPTRFWMLLATLLVAVAAVADEPSDQKSRKGADVRGGSLVICGGGSIPDVILKKFTELAGGRTARLVIIPTATDDRGAGQTEQLVAGWAKWSPASIQVLHTRSRDVAQSDDFVAPLRQATGIWFGGGQQSRIADAYLETATERACMDLLARGGVIGGTSAGAAIQSRLMIAGGNPVARTGTGFDFLPGTVLDQHFRQRHRQPRLARVIAEHPGHVGVGIDESTAVVVRNGQLEVIGDNIVTVCLAASRTEPASEREFAAGSKLDLADLLRAARERGEAGPP